ncbi:hypothetical protein BGZ83_001214 [Gryganskiella cystojenkinii]|nr:hypothetical protein BGZ83_001214 [Gryganskiella cystojenkinii]
MSISETFHGYIETTQDTLLIFEACRRGLLPRICRRLQEKERRIVESGTVFVFDERESGIKRWTDGLVWSPSRILGNFLVYRELDKRNSGKKDASPIDRNSRSSSSDPETAIEKNKERALVGSLTNSYRFKKNGLIKKTMSIVVNGVSQHLISYYSKDDVLAGKLRTPSSVPELASLEISPEFMMKQNFRIPPQVEQSYDHLADHMHSPVSNHSPRTPNGAFMSNTAGFNPGFDHHVRPKIEPSDLSSLDVFSKPYHPQSQQHHPLHTSHGGYNTVGLPQHQQHQHQQQHSYSSQHGAFANNFAYGAVPNGDNASGTPQPLRYLPRSQPFTYPPQAQPSHQQQQPSQQQQHSSRSYSAGSAASLLMSNSHGAPTPAASNSQANDFGFSMGYHSPAQSQPSTFGGFPGHSSSPQISHSQATSTPSSHQQPQPQQQQHYSQHSTLPPSTQSWNDLSGYAYSNTSLGSLSDHSGQQHEQQHDQHSVSP